VCAHIHTVRRHILAQKPVVVSTALIIFCNKIMIYYTRKAHNLSVRELEKDYVLS